MSWLVGIKETFNQEKKSCWDIDTKSIYLLISSNSFNYLITIEEKKAFLSNLNLCDDFYEETNTIKIKENLLVENKNDIEKFFNSIEDNFGGPIFYEKGSILSPCIKVSKDNHKINLFVNKKEITLIDIDHKCNTIKKNYSDTFVKILKFSPTKYFFQKMNYEYPANNQDIIKIIYLIITRFKNLKKLYLPLEIWEHCILKMIIW